MTSTERRVGAPRLIVPVLAASAAIATLAVTLQMRNGPGTMGLGLAAFVGTWTLMMAAMMLPSISPSVPADTDKQHLRGARDVSAFVGGYLIVLAVTGIAAYPLAVIAGQISNRNTVVATGTAIGLCAVCAAYQLSPIKRRCLARCRQIPNRPGVSALRQGLTNGGWCLACNWATMLVLFAFGLMNVAAMAVIAALVYAEIHLPRGSRISRLTAVIATVCATLVLLDPPLAPGLHHAPMSTMR
jgi:predicted metal-binding membrane protein